MDYENFLVGEKRPVCEYAYMDEDGTYVGGGEWLGEKYFKSIGEKPYSV